MKHHFPFKFLNRGFSHISDVKKADVVVQKNAILPISSLLLNCFVELVQVLNVELQIEGFVALN